MQKILGATALDFSYLDQRAFRAKYTTGPGQDQMRLYIEGIHCAKCVRKLEDLPYSIPGVKTLRVEFGRNLAQVEIDPTRTSFRKVADAIVALGFNPIPMERDLDVDDRRRRESHTDLIRLGIAGACAGNIMTFSFATYFGAPPELFGPFAWLSFALYLPVVTYVAWPFYRGAWYSFKQRQLSIDLPMAVASFSGFLFSTIELLRGQRDIYFDSISGFLFLILISRWSQKRLQQRFLRPQDIAETARLQRARKYTGVDWQWVPSDTLKPRDRILLLSGETLPADGELQSSHTHFSIAWLTGEEKAKSYLRDTPVPAGARLMGDEAVVQVVRPLVETGFGKILNEVQKYSLTNVPLVTLADRWAQWLLGIVFVVALAFIALYWSVSPTEAIRRALALIILACPCAMAFGTPLALASALRKSRRKGLIVRSAGVFALANETKTIFFDKTGTLTETALTLRESATGLHFSYQKIVLALENKSSHPIAFALRKALPDLDQLPEVENFVETPGVGVAGRVCGRDYELRRLDFPGENVACGFFAGDKLLFPFTFETRIKEDALETLRSLREAGYRLKILSGDQSEAVRTVGERLGFAVDDIFAGCSPERKVEIVQGTPHAMMVGDGVNDSLAMMWAQVSVATRGGVEAALKSSDVYLSEGGVQGVRDLLALSHQAVRLIRGNLLLSLVYNSLAGTLALMGYINPFVAALLMPLSSGFILLNTWLRSRS